MEVKGKGCHVGMYGVESVTEVHKEGGAPPIQPILDDQIRKVGAIGSSVANCVRG